jgi:UDPglucose--hexose-1-phosphate uridylyltransferase
MPDIRFEAREDSIELLSPLSGFQPERQRVQVRTDPLLGHTSVYNPALRDKAKLLFGDVDRDFLRRLAAEGMEGCVFCPGRKDAAPKYPAALLPEGRLQVGEARLFPNLFPLAKHHAVVVVSDAHFLELREFTPQRIADALLAMQRFMAVVADHDAQSRYATLSANYLFPAGASVMHPHFQLLMGPRPFGHHAALLAAWGAYHETHGSAYGTALVATEQGLGERTVARCGHWHWLAAWAPLGTHELQAVHESAADFRELPEEAVGTLAQGLSRALRCYETLGCLSFNFTLYSQAAEHGLDAPLFLRLIARQNPAPGYRCDDYFLQKLLQTEVILLPPEALAQQARKFFPETR